MYVCQRAQIFIQKDLEEYFNRLDEEQAHGQDKNEQKNNLLMIPPWI